MGLFDFIGNLLSAKSAKKQAGKDRRQDQREAEMQLEATRESIAENARQFDVQRADRAPARKAGRRALGGMESMLYGDRGDPKYRRFKGSGGGGGGQAPGGNPGVYGGGRGNGPPIRMSDNYLTRGAMQGSRRTL